MNQRIIWCRIIVYICISAKYMSDTILICLYSQLIIILFLSLVKSIFILKCLITYFKNNTYSLLHMPCFTISFWTICQQASVEYRRKAEDMTL